jgi:hypothetical protein
LILIVAPRRNSSKNPLAFVTRSDNHQIAATGDSHPDCRSLLIQIVALQKVPPLVDIIRKAAEAKAQPRAQPAPA